MSDFDESDPINCTIKRCSFLFIYATRRFLSCVCGCSDIVGSFKAIAIFFCDCVHWLFIESNRSSIDISSISMFDAGRMQPISSAHSSRTTVTDVTLPPFSDYTIMPPCYDSLQALQVDYDKSAPPSYREVIELSIASAADPLRTQPTTSFSDGTSGTSSSAVDRATSMKSIPDDSSGSTTATGNQYVIAREQPEIGDLNVDDVSIVRVVNRGIESTEGVEVESHGACTANRQSSTTPPIVYNGEIVLSVSVSVRNPSQPLTPRDAAVNTMNRSDSS